jgi:hypothetical protein
MINTKKVIYIDWNIFQDIKQKRSCEGLAEILTDAKKKGYIIPYSYSHIRDLSRCKNDDYIKEDLNYISTITDNWCVGYDENNDSSFMFKKNNPEDLLKKFNENFSKNNDKEWQPTIFIFAPYKVDTSKISKENILAPYLKKYNDIMSPDLINNFICDFYSKFYDDHKEQKSFRSSLKEIISLNNPAFVQCLDMPLYKYLLSDKDIIKENFMEIFESFLALSQKSVKTIPHGEKLTTSYNILDFFPAFSERIQKKNNIKNISTDAEHLFFGSSSKYFIGGDNKMLEKANIVYRNFNISTKVYHKDDFINKISFI